MDYISAAISYFQSDATPASCPPEFMDGVLFGGSIVFLLLFALLVTAACCFRESIWTAMSLLNKQRLEQTPRRAVSMINLGSGSLHETFKCKVQFRANSDAMIQRLLELRNNETDFIRLCVFDRAIQERMNKKYLTFDDVQLEKMNNKVIHRPWKHANRVVKKGFEWNEPRNVPIPAPSHQNE